jgi:hypothetical protein
MVPARILGAVKIVAVHTAVFMLLLGLFTLIVYLLPIERSAGEVFQYLPPVFIIYLAIATLIQYRRAKTQRKRRAQ